MVEQGKIVVVSPVDIGFGQDGLQSLVELEEGVVLRTKKRRRRRSEVVTVNSAPNQKSSVGRVPQLWFAFGARMKIHTRGRPIWLFLGRYRLLVIKGTDGRYAFAVKMKMLVSKLFTVTQTPTQNILYCKCL